jgi:hypothetical protein
MFAALCLRAHPLKHSLAESILVSRVRKQRKKSSLAEKSLAGSLVSRGITILYYLGLCKYTFAQRRNRLTAHFLERIPVVKQRISVLTNSTQQGSS